MAIMDRFRAKPAAASPASSTMADPEKKPQMLEVSMKEIFRVRIIAMAVIVSMGGFIFGYVCISTQSFGARADCGLL